MKIATQRILSLLLCVAMVIALLPNIAPLAKAHEVAMTSTEFVNALYIALNRKTAYISQYPYNLGYYSASTGTISWDCNNLVKSIIWSKGTIVNNYTDGYYQPVSSKYGLGDWSPAEIRSACEKYYGYSASNDFTTAVPGELVFMSGHMGVYVGNGEVIECVAGTKPQVLKNTISQNGWWAWNSSTGYHIKAPWISYATTPEEKYLANCHFEPTYCQVKTTTQTNLKTLPCSIETNSSSVLVETLTKDVTLTVNGIYKNTAGNYWYRVESNDTAKKCYNTDAYLYSGEAKFVNSLSDVTISGVAAPSSLTQGSRFSIKGAISSKYSKIASVVGVINSGYNNYAESASSNKDRGEQTVNGFSYSVYNSTVDMNLDFNELSTGQYTYYLFAKTSDAYCENGTTLKHASKVVPLVKQNFDVTAAGHTHSYTTKVTAPTCTAQGYTTHTCSCGSNYKDTYTDPTGHSYNSTITKQPQCATTGTLKMTCSKCGDSYTQDIPATDHDYIANTVPGDCVSPAVNQYTCSVCGDYYEEEADSWSAWSTTKPTGISSEYIESRKEYRYRDLMETTDTSSTLSGWTKVGSDEKYTDFGPWSSWSTTSVTSTDLKEVEKAPLYRYYRFKCPQCGKSNCYFQVCNCNCDPEFECIWSTIKYSASNYTKVDSVKAYTTSLGGGVKWFFSYENVNDTAIGTKDRGDSGSSVAVVISQGYRYRTRETYTEYSFSKWGDWSAWSTTSATASDKKEVETRTVYRYNIYASATHNYEYAVTTKPTTSKAGVLTGTCSTCSGTTTVTLPKLNTTDYTYSVTKAATCTATGTGKYVWKTTTYGSFYFTATIAKIAHTEVTDAAVAATCTETGLTAGSHCSVCNTVITAQETVPAKGHTEVTDAAVAVTCTESGLTAGSHCSVCNEVLTAQQAVPATGHAYTYAATKSPTTSAAGTLTGTCSVCSSTTTVTLPKLSTTDYTKTTKKAATCTAKGTDTYTWKNTTYLDSQGRQFSFDVTTSMKSHTAETLAAVEATCTETGLTAGSRCSVCKTVITAQETVPAKGHTEVTDAAVAATCTTAGRTAGSHCSVCNTVITAQTAVPATGHTYTYTATKNPTTSATGTLTGTCNTCNGTTTVTLPKLNTTDYTYSVTKAATCTATGTGKYVWKTTTYGTFSFTATISKKAHTEVADAAVAATCTTAGKTAGSHCSVCNTVITAQNAIPAKGHTEVTDAAVAATCTETGKTAGKHCSVCGAVTVAQTTVAAKGHTEVTDAAVAATCTTAGKTAGSHCSVCNAVLTAQKVVPAKGHTEVADAAVAAICTTAGKTAGSHCSVCNEVLTAQQAVPAKGHTEVADAAVAATCTEAGKTAGSHCSVCNEVLTAQQAVPAKGHTEVTDAAVAATCTTAGKTAGKHCSVCGTVTVAQTTVAAKGHAGNDFAVSKAPTTEISGAVNGLCNRCGEMVSVTLPVLNSSDYSYQVITQPTTTATGLATYTWKNTVYGSFSFDVTLAKLEPEKPSVTPCGDNLTWRISGTKLIISGTGNMYDFSSASKQPWADYSETITTVVIEEGVTSVGKNAFALMGNLEKVILPDSIESIGENAFYVCESLETITIPENVEEIGKNAFSHCSDLKEVAFEGDAPEIGENAFSNVSATITYPSDNASWTKDVLANAGGKITLKPASVTAPDAPTDVKASNTSSSVKVSWTKVKDADSYEIYRSTGTGSFQKIAAVDSGDTESYTDTGATTNGTSYRYKVYAVKTVNDEAYKSDASSAAKIVRLSRISLKSVSSPSSKKMTVKWSKNSKVTGYQIQYSTSSSFSSSKTVTVSKASTVSKTISKLKGGKTYYVRIRGYKSLDGTKYYSAWSSAKKIKIKK